MHGGNIDIKPNIVLPPLVHDAQTCTSPNAINGLDDEDRPHTPDDTYTNRSPGYTYQHRLKSMLKIENVGDEPITWLHISCDPTRTPPDPKQKQQATTTSLNPYMELSKSMRGGIPCAHAQMLTSSCFSALHHCRQCATQAWTTARATHATVPFLCGLARITARTCTHRTTASQRHGIRVASKRSTT